MSQEERHKRLGYTGKTPEEIAVIKADRALESIMSGVRWAEEKARRFPNGPKRGPNGERVRFDPFGEHVPGPAAEVPPPPEAAPPSPDAEPAELPPRKHCLTMFVEPSPRLGRPLTPEPPPEGGASATPAEPSGD